MHSTLFIHHYMRNLSTLQTVISGYLIETALRISKTERKDRKMPPLTSLDSALFPLSSMGYTLGMEEPQHPWWMGLSTAQPQAPGAQLRSFLFLVGQCKYSSKPSRVALFFPQYLNPIFKNNLNIIWIILIETSQWHCLLFLGTISAGLSMGEM